MRPPNNGRRYRKETTEQTAEPRSDAFEIGEIRVSSRPAPDARDRLRRIVTLMIKHANRYRQPRTARTLPRANRKLKTTPGRGNDEARTVADRNQPGRWRPALRHGANGTEGAFDRIPHCAIFADTGWSHPASTSAWRGSKNRRSFPLYVVDIGRSLREDVKALTNHSGSRNYVDIPVYLKGRDGEGDGIGRRQCTDNYKIRPIRRRIRELLGLRPRQRVPAGTTIELWLGISTDEVMRVRPPPIGG